MAEQPTIKRRSIFKGLPLAAIAASMPVMLQNEVGQDRVQAAIEELKSALAERYGAEPQTKIDMTASRGIIGVSVLECEGDELCWMVKDGSPLRADDVTGTTDFADWAATRT